MSCSKTHHFNSSRFAAWFVADRFCSFPRRPSSAPRSSMSRASTLSTSPASSFTTSGAAAAATPSSPRLAPSPRHPQPLSTSRPELTPRAAPPPAAPFPQDTGREHRRHVAPPLDPPRHCAASHTQTTARKSSNCSSEPLPARSISDPTLPFLSSAVQAPAGKVPGQCRVGGGGLDERLQGHPEEQGRARREACAHTPPTSRRRLVLLAPARRDGR